MDSKTASYFTNKMGLFENRKGLAIQNKQAIAKAIGKSREQRRGMLFYRGRGWGWGEVGKAFINKKSIRINWDFKLYWLSMLSCDRLSLSGLLPCKEKNLPFSCWSSKVVSTSNMPLFLLMSLTVDWGPSWIPSGSA